MISVIRIVLRDFEPESFDVSSNIRGFSSDLVFETMQVDYVYEKMHFT